MDVYSLVNSKVLPTKEITRRPSYDGTITECFGDYSQVANGRETIELRSKCFRGATAIIAVGGWKLTVVRAHACTYCDDPDTSKVVILDDNDVVIEVGTGTSLSNAWAYGPRASKNEQNLMTRVLRQLGDTPALKLWLRWLKTGKAEDDWEFTKRTRATVIQ